MKVALNEKLEFADRMNAVPTKNYTKRRDCIHSIRR